MIGKKIIAEQNPDGTYNVQIIEQYLAYTTPLGSKRYDNVKTVINRALIHIDALADDNNDSEISRFIIEER